MTSKHTDPSRLTQRETALAWAASGWPVIPLWRGTKRPALRKGHVTPSTDPGQVARWWSGRRSNCGVGIVISGQGVIVVDADGPQAPATLEWLYVQAASEPLPQTYETTTGRGSHRWYQIPDGLPIIRNQYSNVYQRDQVDIKVNGYLVGPGAEHRNGGIYEANWPEVPRREDLPVFPVALYKYLLNTSKTARPASKECRSSPRVTPTVDPSHVQKPPGPVARLLNDESDGRNTRLLIAVQGLVDAGWDDAPIIATCLSYPLGRKAMECSPVPEGFIQQKIDTARNWVRPAAFDPFVWWWALHTSGASSSAVRLGDVLVHNQHRGDIRRGLDWMALHSAQTAASVRKNLRRLIDLELLIVTAPFDVDTPTSYRLLAPDAKVHPQPSGMDDASRAPHHSQLALRVNFPAHLIGHDAFYSAAGSLGSAYPILTLVRALGDVSFDQLEDLTGQSSRTVTAKVDALEAARLLTVAQGRCRAIGLLVPLLDAVAQRVGTQGRRDATLLAYLDKANRYRTHRDDANTPGSEVWLAQRRRLYLDKVRTAQPGSLLAVILARLSGDLDAAADHLVASEMHGYAQGHAASAERLFAAHSHSQANANWQWVPETEVV